MSVRNPCPRCSNARGLAYPFCGPCEDALAAAGICRWCGERPRKPRQGRRRQSRYCPECQPGAAVGWLYKNLPPCRTGP